MNSQYYFNLFKDISYNKPVRQWLLLYGIHTVANYGLRKTVPALSKEFLDIQATKECGFTLKRICDMTRTYSFYHCLKTKKQSESCSYIYLSTIWAVRNFIRVKIKHGSYFFFVSSKLQKCSTVTLILS